MLYDIGIVKRRRIISPNESYFAVPAPVGGTPDVIFGANLIAWYDAADGFTSNKATDRTANHNDLINTSTLVNINATAFNGHPGYGFGPASGIGFGGLFAGTGPSSNSFPALGGAGAVFMAVKATATSDNSGRFVSMGPGAALNDFNALTGICTYFLSAPSIKTQCNSVAGGAGSITVGNYYRLVGAWNATTFFTYLNNVATDGGTSAGGTINVGNSTNMAFSFGCTYDGSAGSGLDGVMGAMVVVNVTPDATQRLLMDQYFTTRFGI